MGASSPTREHWTEPMKRAANLPTTAGVFAVVHAKSKHAYVGRCKNLRQRASMWAFHLKRAEDHPSLPSSVRNLPSYPAAEWAFLTFDTDEATVRKQLEARGFTLINFKARTRTNDAGSMTSVASTLSPQDIENLAHYLVGL